MALKAGDRVSKTVTGTVLDYHQVDKSYFRTTNRVYGPEHYTYVKDDITGEIETFYNPAGGRLEGSFKKIGPEHWPPQPGDLWITDERLWYAQVLDMGKRKALRMIKFEDLGQVVRSASVFLKENPSARLKYRRSSNDISNDA